jgi:hypothetical protein
MPNGEILKPHSLPNFVKFRTHLLSYLRTDPLLSMAASVVSDFRFPDELLPHVELSDDTWIFAPGAIDPFHPLQRLTKGLTARHFREVTQSRACNPNRVQRNTADSVYNAALAVAIEEGQPLETARLWAKRARGAVEDLNKPDKTGPPLTPVQKRAKMTQFDPGVTPIPETHLKYTSPIKKKEGSLSADRAYNRRVDDMAVQQVVQYFNSVPPIIGLLLSNAAPTISQQLHNDPIWTDAVRRKDLVRAWHIFIEVSQFQYVPREIQLNDIETTTRTQNATLAAANNDVATFNHTWSTYKETILLCDPNYNQTPLVRQYASAIMACNHPHLKLIFNATSLEIIGHSQSPDIIAARSDLNLAQNIFQNLLLIDNSRNRLSSANYANTPPPPPNTNNRDNNNNNNNNYNNNPLKDNNNRDNNNNYNYNNNNNNNKNTHKNTHNNNSNGSGRNKEKVLNALLQRVNTAEAQLHALLSPSSDTHIADTIQLSPRAPKALLTTTPTTTDNNNTPNIPPTAILCPHNNKLNFPNGCLLKAACPNMHGPFDKRFVDGKMIEPYITYYFTRLNKNL